MKGMNGLKPVNCEEIINLIEVNKEIKLLLKENKQETFNELTNFLEVFNSKYEEKENNKTKNH